jgi:hypothetical protein
LLVIFTSLISFFFFIIFLFQTIFHKMSRFFAIEIEFLVWLVSFVH